MHKPLRALPILVLLISGYNASSQSLGVNTSGAPAHSSAILDISSTDKGMLVPRMSKAQKNAIASPAAGLLIYQESPDSVGFHFYTGIRWAWLDTAGSKAGWLTTGNAGTNITDNFFGTTDDVPISFRQNNTWLGRWSRLERNYFIGDSSGARITSAQNNTTVGSRTLFNGTTGSLNTAVGSEAMYLNTTGNQNTALGVSALRENLTGLGNTAVGRSAARLSSSGNYNTFIGYASGYSDSISSGNTAVGSFSLYNHQTSGNYNTAIGFESMQYDSAGTGNSALGWRSLRNIKSGLDNTAIGVGALEHSISGSRNTALGRSAGFYADTADYTVSVGHSAGVFNKRDYNVAVGAFAGYINSYNSSNLDQGSENTMIGYEAMTSNAYGSKNTVLGFRAMAISTPGNFIGSAPSRNVAIGDSALRWNFASDNVAVGFLALSSNGGSNRNTAIGSRALKNAVTSYPNTAVGYSSQDSLISGVANTSLGAWTLTKNKLGSNNTAIGNWAMHEAYNPQGSNLPYDNTAVGNDALRSTRYYGNVALGAGVLRYDTSGVYNTAVGFLSMAENLSGYNNTALGVSSLRNNKTGSGNTALGTNAMMNHKSENYNTAIGQESMISDTSGGLNTAIGWRSLRYNLSGFENTALGVGTLEFTDSSARNTAVGRGAMIGIPGSRGSMGNVAIGYYAAADTDSAERSVSIGYTAGYRNQADENVFLGYASGYGYSPAALTGTENTGLGTFTLSYNTTGSKNTSAGYGALYVNSTGTNNTAVGVRALMYNSTGTFNTAIGDSAMVFNKGHYNNAIGHRAIWFNDDGIENTAVGTTSLMYNMDGNYNTAIGNRAGLQIQNGDYNTMLGYGTNQSVASFDNVTAIGALAYVTQANSMVLGSINGVNGATASTSVGIGTTAPYARLHVRRNGSSSGSLIANASIIVEDNTQSYIQLSNPTTSENGILSGSTATAIRAGVVFGTDSSVMIRSGGNYSRLTASTNGYIGIGTTAPNTKLHIYETTTTDVNLRVQSLASSYEPGLELLKSGAGGSDWKVNVNTSGYLMFNRSGDDFATLGTDHFEMSTTSFRPVADANKTLGTIGNRWSTVYAVNGTINTSDARDKENISDLNYGLHELLQLRPVIFNWKDNPQWGRKIGFIAQEVKPVLKEVIQEGNLAGNKEEVDDEGKPINPKSDKLGIYYSDIIPVAVKAIQEQQQQIEMLKKENEALNRKNNQLENEIQLIKKRLGIN